MKVKATKEVWKLKSPFTTSRHYYEEIDTATICISDGGHTGSGEAVGVDLLGENASTIVAQVDEYIQQGGTLDRTLLQEALKPGGARNGIDCALWDLICKQQGKTIYQILGMTPNPVTTVYTIPLKNANEMATLAENAGKYPHLKIKLDHNEPVQKIKAIRDVRPDATLIIDCNQAWDLDLLKEAAPALKELGVKMIEQPLPSGKDQELINYKCPLPLCADESCSTSADLSYLSTRYQMVNVKLDKTGGFTEALKLTHMANSLGLGLMVGNMLGSSLGMAPAFVIAQFCLFVDLDGPLLQIDDRAHPLQYDGSMIAVPSTELWG